MMPVDDAEKVRVWKLFAGKLPDPKAEQATICVKVLERALEEAMLAEVLEPRSKTETELAPDSADTPNPRRNPPKPPG